MKNNIKENWMYKYNLAKAYFKHNGNLEISQSYKTLNGYEYAEEGIALGAWLNTQRQAYKGVGTYKITEEQIKLLEEIGMRFETRDNNEEWNKKYELAKIYFAHNRNLEIPHNYKTFNGYEYAENGITLGRWITNQRQAYKGLGTCKITEEQIKLLEEIGMRFETCYNNEEWNKKYELAKVYFEHNGNLEIPQSYKTLNGYEYAECGIALGAWLNTQRQAYKGQGNCKITEVQIKLLEEIGMHFETNYKEGEWNKKYGLAKAYFEHNGNLEIPHTYKTLNGYEYIAGGIALGAWLNTQRQAYKGHGNFKITDEQIKLLEEIGMRFKTRDNNEEWNKKYELAKVYFEYNGNLEIPYSYKTLNGYEYADGGISLGIWLHTQRKAYKGQDANKITETQIKLLEEIRIKWFLKVGTDKKSQEEVITEKNSKRKQIEMLNRVRSYLNTLDESEVLSKEEINQGMMDVLNHKIKRLKIKK